ncbi:unnamed protein product [Heterosigma akashiwo]
MLVLAMDAGVQIWNAGGTRMVFYLPLDGIIESSPEEMKYCRGIAGVPNGEYIFVGTFTGDVLVITVQVEGGDDRIEFLQALPGHASAVTACAARCVFPAPPARSMCAPRTTAAPSSAGTSRRVFWKWPPSRARGFL